MLRHTTVRGKMQISEVHVNCIIECEVVVYRQRCCTGSDAVGFYHAYHVQNPGKERGLSDC